MKNSLLLFSFISIATLVNAQIPWKIKLGSKTALQTKGEDPLKNVVTLNSHQVGIKNKLALAYKIAADEKDWIRGVMIDDSTGAGIAENATAFQIKKGVAEVNYTLSNKTFRDILKKYKKIKIYFTSIPSDPAKAALVRVRPVHICTISLQ